MVNRPLVRLVLTGLLSLSTAASASAATISGFVKIRTPQGGLAPVSAEVTATDTNNNSYQSTTDQNGDYSLTVPAGTYTLVADGIVIPFTEDCDHTIELVSSSSSDTCLIVVE